MSPAGAQRPTCAGYRAGCDWDFDEDRRIVIHSRECPCFQARRTILTGSAR